MNIANLKSHVTHKIGRLGRRLWRLVRSPRLYGVTIVLAVVMVSTVMDYECYLASSDRPTGECPLLSLDPYQRMIVFAPHCDDEVLGAGGLIQAAVQRGLQVQVVIVTNGDGHPLAAVDEARYRIPSRIDFVTAGRQRQQESLNALSSLGLAADAVTFLGYPDVGLSSLWWGNWSADKPYRSPLSGLNQSPYDLTFRAAVPYAGESLLADLRAVLAAARPDLILSPHPLDTHADHRALYAFLAVAVAMEQEQDPTWSPTLLGYLVHYGLYPYPRGLKPRQPLRPPRQLNAVGEWLEWALSAEQVLAKRHAVEAYRSQVKWSRDYLYSFVRQNELLMRVSAYEVLGVVGAQTFSDAEAEQAALHDAELLAYSDPVRDSPARTVRASTDIVGLRIFRLADRVWVMFDLRAPVSHAYSYRLAVRAFAEGYTTAWQGQLPRARTDVAWASGNQVWFQLDLEALGHPDWLAIAAETRQAVTLDRTGWHLIRLQEWPWEQVDAVEQE